MSVILTSEETKYALETLKGAQETILRIATEANQAVEDIRRLGRMGANICPVCAHYNHGEGSKEHCITCIINRDTDNFEWRGVKNG